MSLIICPECGHENQEDARYCDMCGIELPLPSTTEGFSQTEESEFLSQEEESAPNVYEEMSLEPEPEIFETPITGSLELTPAEQEEFIEEVMEISEQEPIEEVIVMEISQEEPQPIAQTPEPVSLGSSETVLDWDEPDLSAQPSTSLEVIQARLVHPETGTRFELPAGETLIYLGKINEEMPVQIDLSGLPDADIISRVHAVIHVEEEMFYLEDAGSLNGTALNEEALKPGARFRKQLNSGDMITLGRNRKINLNFEIEE